jgi:hypothetical protein
MYTAESSETSLAYRVESFVVEVLEVVQESHSCWSTDGEESQPDILDLQERVWCCFGM